MAHKKSGGSTSNGRDSNPKFHAGSGVKMGRDFTLYAVSDGKVKFSFYNKKMKTVSVVSA